MGDEYGVRRGYVKANCATAWCCGVRGIHGRSIHWWNGTQSWQIGQLGSLCGSTVKRNGNAYLNDQQCIEGLGEYYGTFTMLIWRL